MYYSVSRTPVWNDSAGQPEKFDVLGHDGGVNASLGLNGPLSSLCILRLSLATICGFSKRRQREREREDEKLSTAIFLAGRANPRDKTAICVLPFRVNTRFHGVSERAGKTPDGKFLGREIPERVCYRELCYNSYSWNCVRGQSH